MRRTILGLLGLGAALIAGGFVSRSNGGQVLVPWLFGGLFTALGLVILAASRRVTYTKVGYFEGPVEVELAQIGRGSTEVRLHVEDAACPVPGILTPDYDDWRDAILPGHRYRVWVHGPRSRVVAVENAYS
ncbi:MAG: hypothetical protein J7513_13800 [Solirubrobacteraceae bacterium]|nr:hypothetical protein [Solirubrobacteraceae bacterium]